MSGEDKRTALRKVKALGKEGCHREAFRELFDLADPYDGFALQSQYARLVRSLDLEALGLRPVRIALLGSSTLEHFADVFRFWLACEGFRADLHVAPFDTLRQSILNPDDELYTFDPEIVWLFTNHRDIRFNVEPGSSSEAVRSAVQQTVSEYQTLWDAIRQRSSAYIVQNNSDLPHVRLFGNFEGSAPWTRTNLLRRFNLELTESLPPGVTLFDFEHVASLYGKQRWYDYRYWYHSKHAFSLDALGLVAFHGARLVGALKGAAKKCIVLDLDNTLWGGVIGDDGVEGIKLGNGAAGEAFQAFQDYLRELKERGIVLAVCSKNEEDAAKAPFLNHPDMRLKLDDISVFKANWTNKADNIREIVRILNLGMDAMVFVDDNPAERALVRSLIPECTVPEMPEDPAEYIGALDALRLFETASFSAEDRTRSQMYRENALRHELSQQCTDLSDYLRNLDMEATVGECDDFHLKRMTQLINKSNQFHLTGTRYSEGELLSLTADPNRIVRYFKLKDRFGDNGLISVLILECLPDALRIDTWVMSCRVLSRGMEEFICREMASLAAQRGCERLLGTFVPTKKNRLVSGLYERLGFTQISENDDTGTMWELVVNPVVFDKEIHIRRAVPITGNEADAG